MKIKKNLTELLISIGIILIILSSSDPILYPDSSRYLEGSLDDPPLYSLLIKIILSVFENLNCNYFSIFFSRCKYNFFHKNYFD